MAIPSDRNVDTARTGGERKRTDCGPLWPGPGGRGGHARAAPGVPPERPPRLRQRGPARGVRCALSSS
eukprot:8696912-Alexandrium_andersonii.AAC.1